MIQWVNAGTLAPDAEICFLLAMQQLLCDVKSLGPPRMGIYRLELRARVGVFTLLQPAMPRVDGPGPLRSKRTGFANIIRKLCSEPKV
jgi:hypothetical protein